MKLLVFLALPLILLGQTQLDYKQVKNGPGVSVMAYGALGNGVHNDVTGIQAALNAVTAGTTLVFPPGNYYLAGSSTELLLNSRCISMEFTVGAALYIASSVGSSTDVLRVFGPCSGLIISNFTVTVQSGTPARNAIVLDATSSYAGQRVISNFHFTHPNIAQLGGHWLQVTFPLPWTDGVFDGVIDGAGIVHGPAWLDRAGDKIAIADLNMTGTGPAVYVNQVIGSGNLILKNNSITNCSGAVKVVSALNPKLLHNLIEPAIGCAIPTNLALIDFDGAIGLPIYMPITQSNTINVQPGTGTYAIRDNYTSFAHHGFDQFNFGTGLQYGVLATANSSNTKLLDPSYPGGSESHLLKDQSTTAEIEYMNTGLLKKGPRVQVFSADGTTDANLSVKRTPGQTQSVFNVFDENDHALFNLAGNGSIVFPYSITNSVLPDISVTDSGGSTRRVFFADPGADYIYFGYQSAATIGGGGTIFYANGVARMRLNPSGGFAVGNTSDPGTGQLSVNGLKTSGAAGGKNVVCADTATGKLYVSSTTTDCSN